MSWTPELEELALRKKLSLTMGGEDKVKRQHDNGKLTVRERIDQLVDPQTFREVGGLAGSGSYDSEGKLVSVTPSNVIIGRAQINQRPVVLVGDDFTVRGGANDGVHRGQCRPRRAAEPGVLRGIGPSVPVGGVGVPSRFGRPGLGEAPLRRGDESRRWTARSHWSVAGHRLVGRGDHLDAHLGGYLLTGPLGLIGLVGD